LGKHSALNGKLLGGGKGPRSSRCGDEGPLYTLGDPAGRVKKRLMLCPRARKRRFDALARKEEGGG